MNKQLSKHLRTSISFAIILLMITVTIPLTSAPSSAATTYRMPTKITGYAYKKGKYKRMDVVKYKYNGNKDVSSWKRSDGSGVVTTSYWDNGKLKSSSALADNQWNWGNLRYNEDGQILTIDFSDNAHGDLYYEAGRKEPVKCIYKDTDIAEDTQSFTYSYYASGKVKTISIKTLTQFEDNIFPDSTRNGPTITFTKDGYASTSKFKPASEYHLKVKFVKNKKGLITTVIIQDKNTNKPRCKYVLDYTSGPKVSTHKYKDMINTVALDGMRTGWSDVDNAGMILTNGMSAMMFPPYTGDE